MVVGFLNVSGGGCLLIFEDCLGCVGAFLV